MMIASTSTGTTSTVASIPFAPEVWTVRNRRYGADFFGVCTTFRRSRYMGLMRVVGSATQLKVPGRPAQPNYPEQPVRTIVRARGNSSARRRVII
jgi:hypothetical protein